VRVAAFQELEKLGEKAARPSAEVRTQADSLLRGLPLVRSPELLRRLRAIQALERIGSPGARRLLDTLARGAPAARQTRDAKAALERLARRP
jgi:hypothetical protein